MKPLGIWQNFSQASNTSKYIRKGYDKRIDELNIALKQKGKSWTWWPVPIVPALGNLRQEDQVEGQSRLHSAFRLGRAPP